MEDCTVTSDLREKQKLHLGIQTLITAKSLEGTIYILAPHEEAIRLEVVPFLYTLVYGSYNT